MIDIVAAMNAIKISINCAKGVSEGLKAINEVDQKLAFLEMKQKQVMLIESLLNAKEKIYELHTKLSLQQSMEHQSDGNIMWKIKELKKSGPYCSTCLGDEKKAITLNDNGDGSWNCPKCKNHFNTKQWRQDQDEKHQRLIGYDRYS
ncbi:MAG: hypothetical protein K1000chlam1_01243 [Candidatus Anoxychlamydiales bacterium]|nr:hypothetical protein [Candidatus Anoxychlamydiales bacterium]